MTEIAGYRLIDGEGNDARLFQLAISDLQRLVTTSSPVFVHCHAGRSRSATVVAGYLMRERGLNVELAIIEVAIHREITITPALVQLLEEVEG